jgi:hypothetical protein
VVNWDDYNIIPEIVRYDDRPDRILDVSQKIIESESEWNRLCPRPGFGKSEGGLLTVQEFDKFLAFQYETMWDKYQAYQEQLSDSIKGHPEPAVIVAWEKALGIKSHEGTVESIEELDRDKIPNRFTQFHSDPVVDKIRKTTVEEGGKVARDKFYATSFYNRWADQFRDPDDNPQNEGTDYSDKAIFTTVSMASKFPRIWHEGKTFTDEGLAGRMEGDVKENDENHPMKNIVDPFVNWQHISGIQFNLSIKGMGQRRKLKSSQKKSVETAMKLCRDMSVDVIEQIENNDNEMIMEKTDDEGEVQKTHTVGVLDWDHGKPEVAESKISPLKIPENYPGLKDKDDPHSTYWQAERRENDQDRKKLIALEEAIEWFQRAKEEKIVYLKRDGEIWKMMAPKHHRDIVEQMGEQHFLLKATYIPLWDEKMDLDMNYILEDKSIRKTDLSKYEGDFHYYKYRQDKESINKDGIYSQKMKYLYKLLDEIKSDSLKIVPKKIVDKFDSKVETKESAIGKNFEETDNLYSIGLQRLDD